MLGAAVSACTAPLSLGSTLIRDGAICTRQRHVLGDAVSARIAPLSLDPSVRDTETC